MENIFKYMSDRPAHLPNSAYKYVMEAIHEMGVTKTTIANIMGITKAKFNYHLGKIKRNELRINTNFLLLLTYALDIKLSELSLLMIAEAPPEQIGELQRAQEKIQSYIADIQTKKASLTERQRIAFYPSNPPKTFNTITPDRLN